MKYPFQIAVYNVAMHFHFGKREKLLRTFVPDTGVALLLCYLGEIRKGNLIVIADSLLLQLLLLMLQELLLLQLLKLILELLLLLKLWIVERGSKTHHIGIV